ncbi:MAG: DUF2889 domain-containing protein [Deltaproteobacteria bacterium]|nr:DUF2889 domain-containing protein [Deltaproteobacteria bacterium]
MITFSRSSIVGAEFPDDKTVRFHGSQTDHIYDMEIEVDVRIPEGEIVAIKGWMKRYTTPICPQAVDVLQMAVGISLREEGWDSQIMREIGRKGCEHFAEILIECGRCLDQARMARELYQPVMEDATIDQNEFTRSWVKEHPDIQGFCLARC